VAFYGGSFTLLPERRQRFFLESFQDFLWAGQVQSLRLSTRPDAILPENLRLLRAMGVKTIELGVQSLSDRVLFASGRDHSSRKVHEATSLLREKGFEVGLQLMPGLPEDNRETFLRTVDKSILLQPDFIRLYPTVVLTTTPLENLYRRGSYRPLSVSEAVDWCKDAKQLFDRAAIPIIRMGLQPTASLHEPGRIVAGPYHPAFGQLVKSAVWEERISPVLSRARRHSRHLAIHAAPNQLADIRGHRNANVKKWVAELDLASLMTTGCGHTSGEEFRVTSC
jgi:histone acetyltransferase (RNA polymerase elongator complex component)